MQGFTIPKVLRTIFRKRRKLLTLLFHVSIESLRDWMRTRLDLPSGQLAVIAAVQTFGDYLGCHPHLHVLCATGLVDSKSRFHLMPDEPLKPLIELFRHRFIATLVPLFGLALGAMIAMPLAGWISPGVGGHRLSVATSFGYCVCLVLPALAATLRALSVALFSSESCTTPSMSR